jgi:hypothetical protein
MKKTVLCKQVPEILNNSLASKVYLVPITDFFNDMYEDDYLIPFARRTHSFLIKKVGHK